MFQNDNVQKCVLCNNTNFYKQDGYFFCAACQTQNEDIVEEIFEERFDTTTRLRKTKIKTRKSEKNEIIKWTSWEIYNFVLLGLTNQLIEIGAHPKIKLTVLQLWTQYLSKLEVAFTSKNKKCIPKMARRYHKQDVEIIYGKIEKKKKKKKQSRKASTCSIVSSHGNDGTVLSRELNKSKKLLIASEYERYMQSQASSDTGEVNSVNEDLSSNNIKIHFSKSAKLEARKIKAMSKNISRAKKMNYCKKHITTQYATGPDIVTPLKLLSIIYLALRIENSNIYISDLLRFSREGHISYYKLNHLIPSEIVLTKNDMNFLTQTTDITYKGLRRAATNIAKYLNAYELASPDFRDLIKRFCKNLELPRGILLYTERIFLSSPSVMEFTSESVLIPNYEGRAIAYIIVVLKILFSLDDITEIEISRIVEKINRIGSKKEILTAKLFSFCEWQKYIECRKTVLTNLHFPSKIKYDSECVGISHLYLRFMGLMKSRNETQISEAMNYKYFMSQNLIHSFYHCIDRLNDNLISLNEMQIFSPSFIPLQSYINELKENAYCEIPNILRMNFYETKVGYMTRPSSVMKLATQCEMKLKIADCSIQYLEKIVPPFEQIRILTLEELNTFVKVEACTKSSKNCIIKKSENLLDYSHRNRECTLKINSENVEYYSLVYNNDLKFNETLSYKEDSFFDQILYDGCLNIMNSNSKYINTSQTKEIISNSNMCLLNKQFNKKYDIKLYNHEIEALLNRKKILKEKYVPFRNAAGKFIKLSTGNKKINNQINQKNEINTDNSCSYNLNDVHILENSTKKKKCKNININNSNKNISNEVPQIPINYIDPLDSDISILTNEKEATNVSYLHNEFIKDYEILFRPYKDYWMYHCNFSRVKGKNFELFEKELPENFLWLLNECANIVEMTTEDLYEEVCLIEAYHFDILKSKKSKMYLNILNKW